MTTPKMPDNAENIAMSFLASKNLLKIICDEIGLKVVGEQETIKTIFLCSCGCLVKNNQIASYNLLVNDESGTGKDFVTDAVLSIWPDNMMLKRTRISPQVFTYWKQLTKKQQENGAAEWNWDGKILYLEDVANNVLNCDTFKVMCSSGSYATVVKDQRAVDIKINGKPVIIVTSANANPSAENIRRFSIVNLDATINQTKAIMQRQAERAENGINIQYNDDLTAILSYLQRYSVRIPYANALTNFMPDGVVMRTHFQRFLDYIKASVCLFQFQREVDLDTGQLIAEKQDYEIASEVLNKLTSNSKMISLTKNQQKILKVFEELKSDLSYSVTEIEPKITFITERQLYRELDKLTNMGFLKKDKEERLGSKKEVMTYKFVNMTKINIPSWEELQNHDKPVSNDN